MPRTWQELAALAPAAQFRSWNAWRCWLIALVNRTLSLFLFFPAARYYEFEDPTAVDRNVLDKHVPLCLYSTMEEAATCGLERGLPRQPSAQRSLNLNTSAGLAVWRFQLYPSYDQVPILTTGDKEEEGEVCLVPSSWQLGSAQDPPVYTNISYPFAQRWTHYSTWVPRWENPCGVYSTTVCLPADWTTTHDDVVLILHGAGPFCKVFCNQQELGFHTDSLTEHEYLLPSSSAAVLHLELHIVKYASASYLEDQDQWWLTGLHRGVELQRRRRRALLVDYSVDTSQLDSVHVTCELKLDAKQQAGSGGYCVRVTVPELGLHAIMPFATSASAAVRMACSPGSLPELWTPESPRLYSLFLELLLEGDGVLQVETLRIGFRHIGLLPSSSSSSMRKEIQLNHQRVTFRGVNRHEFSPVRGKSLTEEEMLCDVLQMKRYNLNAVRNSHYPNAHRWYELCNHYGLMVVDEANIETHGFMFGGALSQLQFDGGFRGQFLHRAHAMVARSKNYCCVVMWSLGNESGFGPHLAACAELVREMDGTSGGRLVVYEGASLTDGDDGVALEKGDGAGWVSDVIFPMYTSPAALVERWGDAQEEEEEDGRPVVLCEYAHCMGNSLGNLHEYWDLFWRHPRFQGGFIWDWVDQAFVMTTTPEYTLLPESREQALRFAFEGRGWGYGGDFATRGRVKEDAQFCCNGLVFPDRTPKPGLFEAKYLMQPFAFELEEEDGCGVVVVVVVVRQRYALGWSLPVEIRVGVQQQQQRGDDYSMEHVLTVRIEADLSGEGEPLRIPVKLPPRTATAAFLFVRAVSLGVAAQRLGGGEHEVACDSFELASSTVAAADTSIMIGSAAAVAISSDDDGGLLTASWGNKKATWNTRTGALVSLVCGGGDDDENERLAGPSCLPVFARACVDNDLGGNGTTEPSYHDRWRRAGLHKYCETYVWPKVQVASHRNDGNQVVVRVKLEDDAMFRVTLTYSFGIEARAEAALRVQAQVEVLGAEALLAAGVDSLPRVGLLLELANSSSSTVRYMGRGPHENYPDRKHGARLGVWEDAGVEAFHVPYVYPTENGARCGVRWVELCGLTIVMSSSSSTGPLQMTLSKFHISELDRAKHQSDLLLPQLPKADDEDVMRRWRAKSTKLILDAAHMGVGGDVSWLPSVHDKYKVLPSSATAHHLRFSIM